MQFLLFTRVFSLFCSLCIAHIAQSFQGPTTFVAKRLGRRSALASRYSLIHRTKHSSTTALNNYLDNLSSGAISPSTSMSQPSTTSSSASALDFQTVPILTLAQADAIASNAVACCLRNQFNPVVVQILDAAGHVIVAKRMDGCSVVGAPDFAYAKAYACLVNKDSSRAFREKYTAGTFDQTLPGKFGQMIAMVTLSNGQMAPFPGGILLTYNGHIVGAVGVSGAAGDEDEYCAIRGVADSNIAGLVSVPATPSCATINEP